MDAPELPPSPAIPYAWGTMNPLFLFLVLFVATPLVELYFLIEVGSEIGAVPTIGLTLFTAVLGGVLVRLQGFSTALRVRDALDRGELPAIEMLEGVLLLIAGILLLLPGFVTDAIGFLCLIPQLRRSLVLAFLRRARVIRTQGTPGGEREDIIEGEWRREEGSDRITRDGPRPPDP